MQHSEPETSHTTLVEAHRIDPGGTGTSTAASGIGGATSGAGTAPPSGGGGTSSPASAGPDKPERLVHAADSHAQKAAAHLFRGHAGFAIARRPTIGSYHRPLACDVPR